jgi:peptide/nickel transport system ATP-binding protein
MTAQPLLDVHDLTVEFATRRGIVKAVQHVNISVAKGETLGIVGESGSGKSVTSYAVMRILDRAGRIAEGSVMFSGIDVKGATENQMRDLRGREISMIFQNPRAALNPIRKVGDQIEDVLRQHVQSTITDRGEKAIEALEAVKIARPRERYHAYPFELSGGMCQRVVIALALACNPQLLIADEPTTGLDVTTQKAVMDLIVELTKRRGMSTILITHDLGLAAAYCDRVVVMEKGRVVETALSADIFAKPEHAYTKKLMRATPRLGVSLRDLLPEEDSNVVMAGLDPAIHPSSQDSSSEAMDPRVKPGGDASTSGEAKPLLVVEKLVKEYPRQGATAVLSKLFSRKPPTEPEQFRAVDGISFTVGHGESVGLVGESGCGKSTTSMMVMRLLDQTSGRIMFDGDEIGAILPNAFARLPLRKSIQMVFQDPTDSLNPRFTAARAIADPIMQLGDVKGRDALRDRCEELAGLVGLPVNLLDRFPHQLSGGQKARVGIARAIALHPKLVVLDEPTAALDVSVQAVVLNLLQDLKASMGMSYLFVSHDLNVVRLLCDRVIVMRSGRIVEQGPSESVLGNPQDAYTRELLTAIPHPPLRFTRGERHCERSEAIQSPLPSLPRSRGGLGWGIASSQELLAMTAHKTGFQMSSSDPLDDYIDAVGKALALPLEDAWKPAVRANLEVSLRLARLVDEFSLPDETEPASVFAA